MGVFCSSHSLIVNEISMVHFNGSITFLLITQRGLVPHNPIRVMSLCAQDIFMSHISVGFSMFYCWLQSPAAMEGWSIQFFTTLSPNTINFLCWKYMDWIAMWFCSVLDFQDLPLRATKYLYFFLNTGKMYPKFIIIGNSPVLETPHRSCICFCRLFIV